VDIQIQIYLPTLVVVHFLASAQVATTNPWGNGDIIYPFKIVCVNINRGETKTIYPGITFTLPEDF